MSKSITLVLLLLLISTSLSGQRYFTREGNIKFFSEAPMENIEAVNNKVLCVIDLDKGQVAVNLLIKSFEFEKKLMQEHFNENYLESDKYPKATYTGRFEVPEELSAMSEGDYLLPVVGEISIHGIKQKLDAPVNIKVENGQLISEFEFVVKLADHDIEIPTLVADKISKEILVTAMFNLEPYKK